MAAPPLDSDPTASAPGACHRRLVVPTRVLRLTVKRKWFDLIASGEKKEEYRTPSDWIRSRLEGREYDFVEFKNGYGRHVPTCIVEFKGWWWGLGIPKWGAEREKEYFIIHLGRVIYQHDLAVAVGRESHAAGAEYQTPT